MSLIQASAVSKRFGGIAALSNAEFHAEAGEVHALIGENGAGKSTFIQILAGAVRVGGVPQHFVTGMKEQQCV